eukprot:37495-Eustigmatos_ZCMA.PRE.1
MRVSLARIPPTTQWTTSLQPDLRREHRTPKGHRRHQVASWATFIIGTMELGCHDGRGVEACPTTCSP